MTLPVRVNGQLFPSLTAAARAMGVSVATMHKAYHKGRPELAGKLRGKTRCKPVVIGGVRYPSISEAARCLGRDRETVAKMARAESANIGKAAA